jgi:Ni/Co efflux regulator RcnB
MKPSHFVAALAILVLVTTGASAQDRQNQQFNQHDRQVTQDWYNQHQNNAPRGMRSSDRLAPAEEQRMQSGQPYDRQLRRRSYSVPTGLRHQLPPPPRNHRYVAVGQHVALVDTVNNVLRDVIHLHGQH